MFMEIIDHRAQHKLLKRYPTSIATPEVGDANDPTPPL